MDGEITKQQNSSNILENGKKEINIQLDGAAPQTKLAGLSYLILLAVMILTNSKNQTGDDNMINIVVFCIVSVISLYTINCIVTGSCNIYAWFFSYLVFINALIALIYIISVFLQS